MSSQSHFYDRRGSAGSSRVIRHPLEVQAFCKAVQPRALAMRWARRPETPGPVNGSYEVWAEGAIVPLSDNDTPRVAPIPGVAL